MYCVTVFYTGGSSPHVQVFENEALAEIAFESFKGNTHVTKCWLMRYMRKWENIDG